MLGVKLYGLPRRSSRTSYFIMNTRNALSLMAGILLVTPAAFADVFTIAGYTFNDDNSVTTAEVVEGKSNLKIHAAPLFAGKGNLSPSFNRSGPDSFLTFNRDKSIGRILGTCAQIVPETDVKGT